MSDGIKVYVGNLPERCEERALSDLFSPYGKIGEPRIIKNYAFIHFDSETDAKKAVEDLHKTKLLGNDLTVQISTSRLSNQGRRGGERRPIERRSKNTGLSTVPNVGVGGNVGAGGGILGMGPAALPALNLLTAVNAAAAAVVGGNKNPDQMSGFGNSYDQPPPQQQREPSQKNLSDGYVIYERFYVDPSHPLLKGLPVPEMPRIEDVPAFQSTYSNKDTYNSTSHDTSVRDDPYIKREDTYSSRNDDQYNQHHEDSYGGGRRDDYDNYRERSPIHSRRDFNYDGRDSRPRSYGDYGNRR